MTLKRILPRPNHDEKKLRLVRSFVCRDGRMTQAQKQVLENNWKDVGLLLSDGLIDYKKIFGREGPCVLEIGFGSGQSLVAIAKENPDTHFIGIEMHQPGIGALMLSMQLQQVNNIRIFYADAVEVLKKCIPDHSLDGIQIFFPDPWPKRRHHKRRLIQPDFVKLLRSKLKLGGTIHLATDWEDYAIQMMRVLSEASGLTNLSGENQFSNRSPHRPIITKFEQRGRKCGRAIWELQFMYSNVFGN